MSKRTLAFAALMMVVSPAWAGQIEDMMCGLRDESNPEYNRLADGLLHCRPMAPAKQVKPPPHIRVPGEWDV